VKRQSFSDQVRQLIRDAGQTTYRIAKECEIEKANLSRFMNKKAGLSMRNLDKLARYLNWTIKAD
jgi:transcriptional regulator with XRE-family HTH domain